MGCFCSLVKEYVRDMGVKGASAGAAEMLAAVFGESGLAAELLSSCESIVRLGYTSTYVMPDQVRLAIYRTT